MKQPIPLFIVFRALGILSDKEICEKIVLDIDNPNNKIFIDSLKASIVEANNYIDYESSIKYITSQVIYNPLFSNFVETLDSLEEFLCFKKG